MDSFQFNFKLYIIAKRFSWRSGAGGYLLLAVPAQCEFDSACPPSVWWNMSVSTVTTQTRSQSHSPWGRATHRAAEREGDSPNTSHWAPLHLWDGEQTTGPHITQVKGQTHTIFTDYLLNATPLPIYPTDGKIFICTIHTIYFTENYCKLNVL